MLQAVTAPPSSGHWFGFPRCCSLTGQGTDPKNWGPEPEGVKHPDAQYITGRFIIYKEIEFRLVFSFILNRRFNSRTVIKSNSYFIREEKETKESKLRTLEVNKSYEVLILLN